MNSSIDHRINNIDLLGDNHSKDPEMNELEKLAGFNNNKDGAQLEISDSEEEEVNRNKTEKPSEDGDVPKSPGAESSYSNFM